MPLPWWVARFNLYATNRILGPLARFVPGMAVVVHVGRKSHRQYRTPVLSETPPLPVEDGLGPDNHQSRLPLFADFPADRPKIIGPLVESWDGERFARRLPTARGERDSPARLVRSRQGSKGSSEKERGLRSP